MALTNGQDQSAEIQRKQGRRGLDPGPETKPQMSVEFRLIERPIQSLEIAELFRKPELHHLTLVRGESAWNVGGKPKPEAVSISYFPTLPTRSRQKLTGLAEGYKKICERWSLDAFNTAMLLHLEEEVGLCNSILSGQIRPMTGDLKDRMALVIGISIGLGELFDDDLDAELDWLNSTHSELGGDSPLKHMLKGDLLNLRDVVDLLDVARGIR